MFYYIKNKLILSLNEHQRETNYIRFLSWTLTMSSARVITVVIKVSLALFQVNLQNSLHKWEVIQLIWHFN